MPGHKIPNRVARSQVISNHWFNKANDLHAATRVLFHALENDKTVAQEVGIPDGFSLAIAIPWVAAMNAGLSIEVMFKAYLVRKTAKFVPRYETHDLLQLADLSEIKFSQDQRVTMRAFFKSIEWFGKYPTPKSSRLGRENPYDFLSSLSELVNPGAAGVAGKIMRPSPKKWPSAENYLKIRQKINDAYMKLPPLTSGEFRFDLNLD